MILTICCRMLRQIGFKFIKKDCIPGTISLPSNNTPSALTFYCFWNLRPQLFGIIAFWQIRWCLYQSSIYIAQSNLCYCFPSIFSGIVMTFVHIHKQ